MDYTRFIGIVVGFLRSRLRERLNRLEREMLARAVENNGEIYKLSADGVRSWVRIGEKDYFNENDPSINVTYTETLKKLIIHDCVTHQDSALYELTSKGWKLGRKYKKKWRKKKNVQRC